ncbi:MAG: endo alpha-1,4 polygalactosaminidase [Nocardioidaceae bacterium]
MLWSVAPTMLAHALVAATTTLTLATPMLPPVNAPADYQLGGAYPLPHGVRIVTRDRTAPPARNPGTYNICYINAFQTQPGELHWWRTHHRSVLLRDRSGRLLHDPGWPGEVLLDTSSAHKRHIISAVLSRWVAGCARKGFDAVEPDNLDSFTRSRRLLTRGDNMALARLLSVATHRKHMAIAQKNMAQLPARVARRVDFDFAVAEDCQRWHECASYRRVYHRHLIEIEYSDNGRANFNAACRARGDAISIVYRDRMLVTPRHRGYVFATC